MDNLQDMVNGDFLVGSDKDSAQNLIHAFECELEEYRNDAEHETKGIDDEDRDD